MSSRLTRVGRNLLVTDNATLHDVAALEGVSVGGFIDLHPNPALSAEDLPPLTAAGTVLFP